MADRGSEYVRSRFYQYQRQRRKFSFLVYILTLVFCIISAIQWSLALILCSVRAGLVKLFWLGPLFLILAMLLISLFVFFENLRFLVPLNWLLAFIIVELIVWGTARTVAEATFMQFGAAFGIAAIFIAIFIVIGAIMRHDLTLDVVILFVIAIIFFIGTVFFTLIHIIANIKYALYLYCVCIIITVLLFVMYHAQTINGGRYAEMRLSDHLLGCLIVYHDFVIFFLVFLFILLSAANKGNETLPPITHVDCEEGEHGTVFRGLQQPPPSAGKTNAPAVRITTTIAPALY